MIPLPGQPGYIGDIPAPQYPVYVPVYVPYVPQVWPYHWYAPTTPKIVVTHGTQS